jgi:hypothetical protein
MHSITNSYTVTAKLHKVGNRLSITSCRQPTDCGCSSFHPTIGSEAFILSTLAPPCQAMISPGSSHSSHELCLYPNFYSGPVLCNSKLSLSIMASARFLICSSTSISRPSIHEFTGASPLRAYALLSHVSSPLCIPLSLEGFFNLSCSFCHKESQVCRSLRYFGLTTHVSIHGGG